MTRHNSRSIQPHLSALERGQGGGQYICIKIINKYQVSTFKSVDQNSKWQDQIKKIQKWLYHGSKFTPSSSRALYYQAYLRLHSTHCMAIALVCEFKISVTKYAQTLTKLFQYITYNHDDYIQVINHHHLQHLSEQQVILNM